MALVRISCLAHETSEVSDVRTTPRHPGRDVGWGWLLTPAAQLQQDRGLRQEWSGAQLLSCSGSLALAPAARGRRTRFRLRLPVGLPHQKMSRLLYFAISIRRPSPLTRRSMPGCLCSVTVSEAWFSSKKIYLKLSHRILRHIHEVLNIDEKNN